MRSAGDIAIERNRRAYKACLGEIISDALDSEPSDLEAYRAWLGEQELVRKTMSRYIKTLDQIYEETRHRVVRQAPEWL